MQSVLNLIYPPQCLTCGGLVESNFGLCGPCWRDTPFITGLTCDSCGVPLPGEETGQAEQCDDCMTIARPWTQGRAALIYKDNARKMILALKHGDRLDLVQPAAAWLAKAAAPLLRPNMVIAPVPLHWMRLLKRRYNQSALLAEALANEVGYAYSPDLLIRAKRTMSQDGKGREARFKNVSGAIRAHPKRMHQMAGRPVLLVDDVMTSGATLAAATEACLASHASEVCILTLARVAKDD